MLRILETIHKMEMTDKEFRALHKMLGGISAEQKKAADLSDAEVTIIEAIWRAMDAHRYGELR